MQTKERTETTLERRCQLLFNRMKKSNLNKWWKIILFTPLAALWLFPANMYLFNILVLLTIPFVAIYFFRFRFNLNSHEIKIRDTSIFVTNFWETIVLLVILVGVINLSLRTKEPDYFVLVYVVFLFCFELIHFRLKMK